MTPHVSNRFILFAATPIYAPGLIRLFLSSIPKRAIHLTFRTHYIFFCGRKADRIKGLVWEQDGFLLLYKRLENGKFVWPRTESDVQSLTPRQFRWLMEGLTITPKKSVQPAEPPEYQA